MSRLFATCLFVTLATMWGLSFPAISVGLEHLPPLLFAAFRYDTAAMLLLGYAVATTDSWRPVGRNNLEAVLWGGLFLVAGNGLLFIGQQTVPSGVTAILQALVPILTPTLPTSESRSPSNSSAHSAVRMGTSACRMAATPLGTVCWPMNSRPSRVALPPSCRRSCPS